MAAPTIPRMGKAAIRMRVSFHPKKKDATIPMKNPATPRTKAPYFYPVPLVMAAVSF